MPKKAFYFATSWVTINLYLFSVRRTKSDWIRLKTQMKFSTLRYRFRVCVLKIQQVSERKLIQAMKSETKLAFFFSKTNTWYHEKIRSICTQLQKVLGEASCRRPVIVFAGLVCYFRPKNRKRKSSQASYK